ncbi:MAG: glycoside hydrolase family 10 protein [Gemmatimonadaceae bacterium]
MPYNFGGRARVLLLSLAVPILSVPYAGGAALGAPRRAEPAAEGRALWINRFEYNSAAEIAEAIARAASANFNVIYFQVRGQGDAYYRSHLEPCAIRLCGTLGNGSPPYDPLEIAVREAHARGIQLHAWLNALTGWAAPTENNAAFCSVLIESRRGSPRHMLLAHPDWVMTTRDGTPMDCYTSQEPEYAYVSPGIPAVRAHLAAVAADVVRRYAVDGVHLDRIRYPGPGWSYDEPSLSSFRARYRREPGSASDSDWARFRREQIDATVKAVFDSITSVRPGVSLSAAVWPVHDRTAFGWPSSSGVSQFYQNPRVWASGGYVDVVAPMAYFAINERYCSYNLPGGHTNPDWACLLDDHQTGLRGTRARLYMGLWAELGAEEVARQVRLGREKGVDGFAVYSYASADAAGLFASLPATVFADRAVVPPIVRN